MTCRKSPVGASSTISSGASPTHGSDLPRNESNSKLSATLITEDIMRIFFLLQSSIHTQNERWCVITYGRRRHQLQKPYVLPLNTGYPAKKDIKKSAKRFGIPPSTLHEYINKHKNLPESERGASNLTMEFGYKKPRQVFSNDQEQILVKYLLQASSIFFGLVPTEVRILAHECAKRFSIVTPPNWSDTGMAGPDWFSGFMKRHTEISLRIPEATSIARATAFNRVNVAQFFEKLSKIMDKHKIQSSSIWNVDESGIMTVTKPNKVVAGTGTKQVGALSSAQRGDLVTLCAAVSASGRAIPPFLIFPRVRFQSHFLKGAPPGTRGSAYPSGWMTGENFLLFMKHFVQHVKPSKKEPVLLLLDNHESHLSIEVLDYAKQSGVIMLSFPPHCSHRLQPLDVAVFGPLKKKVSQSQSNWLRSNPGKRVTIYEIAETLSNPWMEAFTMSNIISGFAKTGIYPYNNDIFSDADFMPSDVTDRPNDEPAVSTETPITTAETDGPNNLPAESADNPSPPSDDMSVLNLYLREHDICLIPVRGDGHCLLYAISSSLHAAGAGIYTDAELGKTLTDEFANNGQFYKDFASGDVDLVVAAEEFLREKQYNNNTCDMFLNAMCNAMGLKTILIRVADKQVNEIEVIPSRPGVYIKHTIHLTLHGSGFGAHYNAAVGSEICHPTCQADDTPDICQSPPTNTSDEPNCSTAATFSPEVVMAHPKAPKRKEPSKSNARKRRKTCVLTDTPEKEELRAEQEARKKAREARVNKAKQKAGKGTSNPPSKKTNGKVKKRNDKAKTKAAHQETAKAKKKAAHQETANDSDGDEDECYCLVCVESFSNSRPNEKWIQCTSCKRWSHEECAGAQGKLTYICHNCDSDDEL